MPEYEDNPFITDEEYQTECVECGDLLNPGEGVYCEYCRSYIEFEERMDWEESQTLEERDDDNTC